MIKYILLYLAVINFAAVLICIHDKNSARKSKRRISEKTLFILAFLGGAMGLYITMLKIRHKTLHKRFMIGLPIIIVLQWLLFLFAVDKFII